MKIFETHAHLDLPDFNKDRDAIIQKCFTSGIEYIINIGYNKETSEGSIALARKYPTVYATVGYHPHDANDFDPEVVKQLARDKKVVAIGEIGLDYFRNLSSHKAQLEAFASQVQLAHEFELPIVVHDRDAHEECYEVLKKAQAKEVVFHCFSGDVIFAEKLLAEGWYLSFTGNITYKSSLLEDVVRMVPEDRFFVETDSPYLSPMPHRGERNSPLNLPYVVQKIADIKRIAPNKVAELAYNNAKQFFSIK